MPRHARIHSPGALVHVIARTVDHQPRFDAPFARAEFLERLSRSLARCDWQLLAYATMSTHFHLAMLAGEQAPSSFLRPTLTSIAMWLNRADARLGPVFAERAKTIIVPTERAPQLIAYIHNNPVRAKIVSRPDESGWTSHRAVIGFDASPGGLDTRRTLEMAGFEATRRGMRQFDGMVRSSDDERLFAETKLSEFRVAARRDTALPVELASPVLGGHEHDESSAIVYAGELCIERRWTGPLEHLVDAVCLTQSISREELRSRSRSKRAVRARRLALVVGARLLRRDQCEVAASLGIASSTASMLLRRSDPVMRDAIELAAALRAT